MTVSPMRTLQAVNAWKENATAQPAMSQFTRMTGNPTPWTIAFWNGFKEGEEMPVGCLGSGTHLCLFFPEEDRNTQQKYKDH
jgi:hypothetical protein